MKITLLAKPAFVLLFLTVSHLSVAQQTGRYDAIHSGVPWFDDKGNTVSAHGANIIKDNGRYYLFGEAHTDTSNAFVGFNCYSSADLYNWKFESVALPVQQDGRLGPNRVGERPKVMKCPKTGEYVMYMHSDDLGYKDQAVGYATSSTITGPYTFQGPLLFNGQPIRRWDMGSFQDKDGSGYILIHGGFIYKLSDDYKSITEMVHGSFASGFESPALFRKDSIYYFLGSHLTSWERNDNDYYTATSLKGPWTKQGLFAPEGTLTWNSQTSFVLPIEGAEGTTYMFMGDRWAFPKQASAATYVWQPLTVSGHSLSIPTYHDAWQINTVTGVATPKIISGNTIRHTDKKQIKYSGNWKQSAEAEGITTSRSDGKGDSFSVKFKGTQIGMYGLAGPDGGYARILLHDSKGKTLYTSIVDMYSKYPVSSLKFICPVLPKGNYTLTVSVMGERGNWSDKRKSDYGSTGNFVTLDKLIINN
ncbi:family 43 glycosylhydrolase [Botryobacter ruber]|uniref:family 43 glycosylhydrolase n=1 Tax=Botryobacter ruber TaxID=2171629 RepID=UPI000E0C1D1C|nr:family 43 glycosylhydrolase [Botryobacter ruber]